MHQVSNIFNDKVLIRSLPGLGVDSVAVILDFLVNKKGNLNITADNRSNAESSISRQFFKLPYFSYNLSKKFKCDKLILADKAEIKKYMYDNYLNTEINLKIITSHFRRIDYDYIFDNFYVVDLAVSEKFLIKTYLIFFYKYALHITNEPPVHSNNELDLFFDYNIINSTDNKLQKKLKKIFKDMAYNKTDIRVPMYLYTLAEENKLENDYFFFIKDSLDRMVKYVNIPYKSNLIIDSEDYLFNENCKAVNTLLANYSNEFNQSELKTIEKYLLKKVLGNNEILNIFNYKEEIESYSYSDKIEWLLNKCVPKIIDVNRKCNYNVDII